MGAGPPPAALRVYHSKSPIRKWHKCVPWIGLCDLVPQSIPPGKGWPSREFGQAPKGCHNIYALCPLFHTADVNVKSDFLWHPFSSRILNICVNEHSEGSGQGIPLEQALGSGCFLPFPHSPSSPWPYRLITKWQRGAKRSIHFKEHSPGAQYVPGTGTKGSWRWLKPRFGCS